MNYKSFIMSSSIDSRDSVHSIPSQFRKLENLHIVFWLIKDLSWAMLWKPLALLMIVPTLSVALIITWQARHLRSELYHNLAVTFWILANAFWMVCEFLEFDYLRTYTIFPFSIGLLIIAWFYVSQFVLNKASNTQEP